MASIHLENSVDQNWAIAMADGVVTDDELGLIETAARGRLAAGTGVSTVNAEVRAAVERAIREAALAKDAFEQAEKPRTVASMMATECAATARSPDECKDENADLEKAQRRSNRLHAVWAKSTRNRRVAMDLLVNVNALVNGLQKPR